MCIRVLGIAALALIAAIPAAAELPDGYWPAAKAQEILDVTLSIRLDPDLSHLSDAETAALPRLIAAGHVLNNLYEEQKHAQALAARAALLALPDEDAGALKDLYYLSKGPIATTLGNTREPILPVPMPGRGVNVYPEGLTQADIDVSLANNPDASAIAGERTAVRAASTANLEADLATLDDYPGVEAVHPGLRQYLQSIRKGQGDLYAVPYALAYAPQLAVVRKHLDAAADILESDSPDFADYLRLRSRDLLSSDYEAGDAAWVTGSFNNLNAQIGSYETYDDSLLGVKAFYSASILARDADKSAALEKAVSGLQAIEDALPYESRRNIRSDIPVGAYNVIADFGQARGANTATILPNDADHTRKYGRTILVRYNILSNPDIFANTQKKFAAVVAPELSDHLTIESGFERTLWHEVGHYLGVAQTADGRSLDVALGPYADLLEEMKADLVSLFAARRLRDSGYYDSMAMQAHYASGIRRTLQSVRPRPEQPYQNMQLMQFNFFLEHGLIELDNVSGLLKIDYQQYDAMVTELLGQVLQLQRSGDQAAAREFVERWNYWEDRLHGRLAGLIRENAGYRRTLVRYAAIDD